MIPPLPSSWQDVIGAERSKPYFDALERFVADEQAKGAVFPSSERIFAALEMTPFERMRVLVLGQDEYPTQGHAHGLALSVQPGVKPPASLCNIYNDLSTDIGIPFLKTNGSLEPWGRQGVLLLNTVL